jgi:energy-coupling factor transport system substrate-specific component
MLKEETGSVYSQPLPGWLNKLVGDWSTSDLAHVGVFAALSRVIGLGISLAGGGINPLSLILKNVAATAILVVYLHKVPRNGALALFVLVQAGISVLLMGKGVIGLSGMLIAVAIVEGLYIKSDGYQSTKRVVVAVLLFEILFRAISLGMGYFAVRESMMLFIIACVVVSIGTLGCFAGLWLGVRIVRELRTAGILRR